jgi:hypothetical protein
MSDHESPRRQPTPPQRPTPPPPQRPIPDHGGGGLERKGVPRPPKR